MAKRCAKCGQVLRDEAVFCPACGAKADVSSGPALKPKPENKTKKTKQNKTKKTKQEKTEGRKPPTVLILIIIAALLITGFWYPGFLRKKKRKDPEGEVFNTPTPTAAAAPQETSKPAAEIESPFHSDPVDRTVFEGFHVTAPANALYEDTELVFTPLGEEDSRVAALNAFEQEEGNYLLSAWESDAGLEEDQVLPGEYTVELDLSTMEIPESLYPYLRIVRLDDSGNLSELVSALDGHKLVYSSDNNSVIGMIVIGIGVTAVLIRGTEIYLGEAKKRDSYYGKGGPSFADVDSKWGEYRVNWNMSHMDPEHEEAVERLQTMELAMAQQAQEEYDLEQIERKSSKGSLYWIYHKNLSVADRLVKIRESNRDYQELKKQLKVPEAIEKIIERIDLAYEYLGEREKVKLPKFRVNFYVRPKDGENLGGKTQTTIIRTYVDLMVKDAAVMIENDSDSVTVQDNLLLTITHELFHVCQDRYHTSYLTDSNRFDEIAAVLLETDAKTYYQANDHITTDPKTTDRDYWLTLVCPIDQNPAGHSGDNRLDDMKKFMQAEGYTLSGLVEYIRDETGIYVSAGDLMRTRSYIRMPDTSGILTSAFGIPADEFDIHFRRWCINNRDRFLNSKLNFTDSLYTVTQYPEITLLPDTHMHFNFITVGKYAAPMHHIKTTDVPVALIMKLDADASKLQSVNLVPGQKYKRIKNGTFESHVLNKNTGKAVLKDRCFIEIYGNVDTYDFGGVGYTVWSVGPPSDLKLSNNESSLFIQLPEPKGAAAEGVMDGARITVYKGEEKKKELFVTKEEFGKKLTVPIMDLDVKEGESEIIGAYMEEYVVADTKEADKLYAPSSNVVSLIVNGPVRESSAYRLPLQYDSLSTYSSVDFKDVDNWIYETDEIPSGNTIRISEDSITIDIPALEWGASGKSQLEANGFSEVSRERSKFTVHGVLKQENYDATVYTVTSAPSSLKAASLISVGSYDPRAEEFRISNTKTETSLNGIDAGNSEIKVRFNDDGTPRFAEIILRGTKKEEKSTWNDDDAPYTSTTEREGSITIQLSE